MARRAANPTLEARLAAFPDARDPVLALRSVRAEGLGPAVIDACRALGFAQAGVCVAAASDHRAALHAWLAAGAHGSMAWLAEDTATRTDPARFVPGARTIIAVADQYADGTPDLAPSTPATRADGGPLGRIARYARGTDYHRRIKDRLHLVCDVLRERFAGEAFRAFSDIEPVLEREHAARAGLGWIGKHTLLIHPVWGSYLLLGGIVTTLDLRDEAAPAPIADHCGTCTRCLDACPTGAITPYRVDASRCIAYLTIERREPIDPARHADLSGWLFGCDVCQEVCPHNAAASRRPRREVDDAYAAGRASLPLLDLLGWTYAQRSLALTGSALKRARFEMLKRNAAILAGNALRSQPSAPWAAPLRDRLAAVAADGTEPALVRDAARAALARASPIGA